MNTEEKHEFNESQTDANFYGTIEDNQDEIPEMNTPSNMLTGIIGALIGSLIGVALWIFIYHLGYMASIAGLVIIICAFKGYELLGFSLDKAGVIITVIIVVAMVPVANHLAWTVETYLELKKYVDITFFDALKVMPDLIKEADATIEYLSDIGVGYLLTFVGGFTSVINQFKQAK